ncbi:MAG: DUF6498-containing protein [Parahaliea sp.]
MLVEVVQAVLSLASPPSWWLTLYGPNAESWCVFIANFIFGSERKNIKLNKLMMEPYNRIVILHLSVLLGGDCCQYTVAAIGHAGYFGINQADG